MTINYEPKMFIILHTVNSSSSSSSSSVLAAEQRQILAADERKREFHEEKRNEFESYAEEENDGTQTLTHLIKSFTHSLEPAHSSSKTLAISQNKTRGAGRAPSSGGSFTTTGCILPRSTTVTPSETERRNVFNITVIQ